ncbi:MAG: pyruvate ferredoxin oxidoreductase [Desulfarculales bacterium]|jgi:pyruvate ferredoxin oxidoreductase alpha subunit|nr:pyruvate ferredoxin oxidoreductase [Desulfarculales bacterium]
MAQRVGIEVSLACAEAVKLARTDVVSAYPITPQTHIVEHLAELVANGELEADFIPVESEHSAMSACIGSVAAGARTFTSSSAQGLALMHEMLFIASAMRLPVVMAVANRALSGPLNIWNDHSDIMAERDIGWVQTFAENGQEVVDLTLHAFKVAEDPRVSLPTAINMDGFILTHVIESIELPDQKDVDAYLPPFKPLQILDPGRPRSLGVVGGPEIYTEARKAETVALENAYAVVTEHFEGLRKQFGRAYKPVETYKSEDAEVLFITMGSLGQTCMSAVDEMRAAGRKAGVVRIRLWRPFPAGDFIDAVKGARQIIVCDRAISPGACAAPVGAEIKSLLFNRKINNIYVSNPIIGLGGRDVTRQFFKDIYAQAVKDAASGKPMATEIMGVKE